MRIIKFLFLSLVVLCLVPLALAGEETTIHDVWHPYHDFFTIGTDYYEIIVNHYIEGDEMLVKMMVKRNQAQTIVNAMAPRDSEGEFSVRKQGCKTEGMLTYCIVNVSFDPSKSGRADESGQYHYGTRVKIIEEKPDEAFIDTIRTVKDTILPYGKETKVTLTFTNKGTKTATNVSYRESLGKGIQAVRQEGFWTWNSQSLSATFPVIYIDEEKSVNYYIKTVEYANTTTIVGNLSYLSPTKKSAVVTSAVTIPWSYTFTCALTPTKVKPGEEATYACSLTNKDAFPITATVDLSFPSFYIIKRSSGLTARGFGTATATIGSLSTGASAITSLTFVHTMTGIENLSASAHVLANDQEFSTATKAVLTIATDGVNPSISLSKARARGDEPLTAGVYLTNTDKVIPYHSLQGYLQIGTEVRPFALEKLSPSEHENALFITTTLPQVEGKTLLPVMVNGTYYTPANELRTFSTRKEITLFPKNASVVLTVTPSSSSAKRGQNLTITVKGENVAESGLSFVEARDTVTLPVISGATNAESYLYGVEEKVLYVYQVRIPDDYTESQAAILTTLTAKGQVLSTIVTTIAVTNPLDPSALPTVDEPTPGQPAVDQPSSPAEEPKNNPPDESHEDAPQEPAVVDEEPKKEGNAFSRAIKAIADFFAGFFG